MIDKFDYSLAAIGLIYFAVLCIAAIALYAVHKGHDGIIVGSSSGSIGAACGYISHKYLKGKKNGK